jgi:UDP-2,3-diacylglucosamine hydrolase
MRTESRSRKAAIPHPADWADVNGVAALSWLDQTGAHALIHGHTHRPGDHHLGDGRMRHVLSDWDLDGEAPRAEVLRIDEAGLTRRRPMIGQQSEPHGSPWTGPLDRRPKQMTGSHPAEPKQVVD